MWTGTCLLHCCARTQWCATLGRRTQVALGTATTRFRKEGGLWPWTKLWAQADWPQWLPLGSSNMGALAAAQRSEGWHL